MIHFEIGILIGLLCGGALMTIIYENEIEKLYQEFDKLYRERVMK